MTVEWVPSHGKSEDWRAPMGWDSAAIHSANDAADVLASKCAKDAAGAACKKIHRAADSRMNTQHALERVVIGAGFLKADFDENFGWKR